VEAGCDPARFWTITPAEAAREMRGRASVRRHEQQQMAWLAWHIEALARSKKMPSLQEMTGAKSARSREPQDPDVMLANLKLAFGYPGETKQ
jgi:hypothetical protein